MTDETPVPLGEQIEFIRVGICALDEAGHDVEMMRAVLATLQQHERDHFVCKARRAAGPDPQDCDWPQCGCDPKANRVLESLQESGLTLVSEIEQERAMAVVEAALRFCMLNGTKKAEAHKDLADAVMWFTPWKAALDDAASVSAPPAGKGETG